MEYRHPLDPFVRVLERRFGWAAFPGPIRILAIFQVVAYLLSFGVEGYADLLTLDKVRILENGEVWRLITFLFPVSVHPLFLIFMVMIMWMINDGMETEWGSFRVNLYLFGTWLGLLVAAWMLPASIQTAGPRLEMMVLSSSLFIAFATLHPKHVIHLFFILPVEVRWLALLDGVWLGLIVLGSLGVPGLPPGLLALPVFGGMAPYLLVFLPRLAHRGKVAGRRARFQSRQISPHEVFHRCSGCGISDRDHPETDFRVGRDGEEYCESCLAGKP